MSAPETKRVYILGAGSSRAHSGEKSPLIREFFSKASKSGLYTTNGLMVSKILKYAQDVFGAEIFNASDKTDVEALYTNLEIDIERKGSSPHLLLARMELLDIIRGVLLKIDSPADGDYHRFAEQLCQQDTIITYNWDLLLDDVLERKQILENYFKETGGSPENHYWNFTYYLSAHGDISIDRMVIDRPYLTPQPLAKGYYLKLHGSIDWQYCTNELCRGFAKGFPIPEPERRYYCSDCHEPLELLIIPPTLNKNVGKFGHIRRLWTIAAKEMEAATELIVWGYSLPPTDFHSAWLIRQASKLDKLVLINPSAIEDDPKTEITKEAYRKRFTDLLAGRIKDENIRTFGAFSDFTEAMPRQGGHG